MWLAGGELVNMLLAAGGAKIRTTPFNVAVPEAARNKAFISSSSRRANGINAIPAAVNETSLEPA